MKINKLFLALVVTFVAMFVFGCSSAKQTPNQANENIVAEDEQIAIPEEEPTLTGKVKEIVDNKVTVYKAAALDQASGQPPANEGPPGGNPPANEGTPGENPPSKTDQATDPNNDKPRPGNMPPELQVTEETETFTIPADTPIVSMQRGSETIQMNLTDIKADQFLRVWQKDDAVYFVQVMSGVGPRAGNPEDTGNNGPEAANSESTSSN